ncbi:MAG: hypothetical protein Q9191_007851, partial [Dirinaria sp. TL-2023a]
MQSVSVLGGWMSGGGHGPAVHDYGLGADQLLSAIVILASGAIVTASPCSNRALFFAIRGGGGSTYGVVIQTTIKAYPMTPVSAIQISIAPNTEKDVPAFMDAVAAVHTYYPDLSDRGFSGYGSWSISSPSPIIENYTGSYPVAGFTQIYAIFNTSLPVALDLFSPLSNKLQSLQNATTGLYTSTRTYAFPTYWAYYSTLSNVSSPIGQSAALGSRLLDRRALTSDLPALKSTLNTLAGDPNQFTSTNIVFVGGGAVSSPPNDANSSAVNPAWRRSYVHNIVARGWAPGTNASAQQAIHDDITHVKVAAMKRLAPDTGCYMNEAD